MADLAARDQAHGAALASAAVMAHLLRALVDKDIFNEASILALLHSAELDLLHLATTPGAMAAGHVTYLRKVFQGDQPEV